MIKGVSPVQVSPPYRARKGARREYVDANATLIGWKVVVVGDEWRLRRNTQRCEFPILRVRNENEALRIDGAEKLRLGLEKISNPTPSRGAEFGAGSSRSPGGSAHSG
jgi:hypothetical protein